MKKFALLLLAFTACYSSFAQNDTVKKPGSVDMYHGVNVGFSYNSYLYGYNSGFFSSDYKTPIAPVLGYYLDVHMRGRTWLFMQFNLSWARGKYQYKQGANVYTGINDFVDLNVPIRFGFRLGKEDADFNLYPTAGFGIYFPIMAVERSKINGVATYTSQAIWLNSVEDVPFYPLMNIGFEAKWRFSRRNNLAIGFNSNYLLAENSFYLKFGWNKYKKDKKKE